MNRRAFLLTAWFFCCLLNPAVAQPSAEDDGYLLWIAGAEAWLGADFSRALEHWLNLVQKWPDSAPAVAASASLAELVDVFPDAAGRLQEVAKRIEERGPLSAECRRRLLQAVCTAAWAEGRAEEARLAGAAAGAVGDWRMRRKYGQPTLLLERYLKGESWPELEVLEDDCLPCGRRSLAAGKRPGLFIGGREFSTPQGGIYYLVIESAAPTVLRIDGKMVLLHDTHRRKLARERRALLQLAAGSHLLELATAVEDEEEFGFWLMPLSSTGDAQTSLAGAEELSGDGLKFRELEYLLDGGERYDTWLLRAVLSLIEGRSDRALGWLQELRRAGHRPELVSFWLALAFLDYLEDSPELARRRARNHLEKIAQEKLLAAYLLGWLLLQEEGALRSALGWLRRGQQASPGVYLWHWLEGRVLEKAGFDAEAVVAFRRALEIEPKAFSVAEDLFRLAESRKDAATARHAAELLALGGADEQLVGYLRARRENRLVEDLLRRKIVLCPRQVKWQLQLADLLLEQRRTAEAREAIYQTLGMLGEKDTLIRQAADLLDLLGEDVAGAQLRDRLLKLYPADVQLQLIKAVAGGEKTLRLPGETLVDTASLLDEAGKRPLRQDVAAERILDQATVQFFPEGQLLMRVHLLVRVNNQEGVAKWGEIEAPGENTLVEALRTIKSDGRIYNAEFLAGKETVSLPQLAAGDFVEVKLLAGQAGSALAPAGTGWVYGPWYFASQDEEIELSRLTLIFPQGQSWRLDRVGDAPEPQVSDEGAWRVLRFEARGQPAVVQENHAPPADEIFPSVQLATIGWQETAKLLGDHLARAAQADDVVRELAFRVSGGPRAGARGVERLFYWVIRNIRQTGDFSDFSTSAAQAVALRQGNRLVVLCALLSALGLDFRPLLARPITVPPFNDQVPRSGVFVSPVVEVTYPERSIWLQPQEEYQPAGLLKEELLGQPALLLLSEQGQPAWVYLPDHQNGKQEHHIEMELQIEKNGSLRGRGREIFQPLAAVRFRQALARLPVTSRHQVMQSGLAGAYPGSQLESWRIDNLERPELPLILSFEFQVPQALERTREGWLLRGGFFPYRLYEHFAPEAKRRFPLLIAEPIRISSRVIIKAPDGWLAEPPRNARVQAPLAKFEYFSHRKNRELIIEKRVEISSGRIATSDLKAFRDFLQRVGQLEAAAIFFRNQVAAER